AWRRGATCVDARARLSALADLTVVIGPEESARGAGVGGARVSGPGVHRTGFTAAFGTGLAGVGVFLRVRRGRPVRIEVHEGHAAVLRHRRVDHHPSGARG